MIKRCLSWLLGLNTECMCSTDTVLKKIRIPQLGGGSYLTSIHFKQVLIKTIYFLHGVEQGTSHVRNLTTLIFQVIVFAGMFVQSSHSDSKSSLVIRKRVQSQQIECEAL